LEFFKDYNPIAACKYPFPVFPQELSRCSSCVKEGTTDNCCIANCIDEVLTDFLDLTISNDLLTAAFEQAIASQNLSSEEWLPVIEQSINFCNETGQCVSLVSKPLTQVRLVSGPYNDKQSDCDGKLYLTGPFFSCLMESNFARCPYSSRSNSYHEMTNFLYKNKICRYEAEGTEVIRFPFWAQR
jgi:hypothetical protein